MNKKCEAGWTGSEGRCRVDALEIKPERLTGTVWTHPEDRQRVEQGRRMSGEGADEMYGQNGGHVVSWCETRVSRAHGLMEADDWLWPHLMGTAERRGKQVKET